MGKHLSKYSSESDYNNNKDNHVKPHISLITSSPKKMKYEKKTLLKLIIFTINEFEYQAEEGMTWEEWIDTEYNTNIQAGIYYHKDYIIKNNNVMYAVAGGNVCMEGSRLHPGRPVLTTDVIINQHSYEHGLSTDPA